MRIIKNWYLIRAKIGDNDCNLGCKCEAIFACGFVWSVNMISVAKSQTPYKTAEYHRMYPFDN